MKKIVSAVALAVLLAALASGQDARKPTLTVGGSGDPSFHGEPGWGNPPADAAHLIFYGGDLNQYDPNATGFANGNTLLIPDTTTYGAVTVPAHSKVIVTGILFNQLASQSGQIFDPPTATYDIRINVSMGNGGTSVFSGSNAIHAQPTGRVLDGFTEYATSVAFTKQFVPKPGTTYWVNLSPQCTDASNKTCSELEFYEDNTTQQTNGINPQLQPAYQGFFDSPFLAFPWINLCDVVGNGDSPQCAYLSFGIYGQ